MSDEGLLVVVDDSQNAYFTGTTTSSNLPTTTGAFDEMGRVGGFFDPGERVVARKPLEALPELANVSQAQVLADYKDAMANNPGDVDAIGDTEAGLNQAETQAVAGCRTALVQAVEALEYFLSFIR